ncbi:MAG: hypothetical protein SGARI_005643 [Bacillariaceae sp.]
MLSKYNATATFMAIQQFLTPAHDQDVIRLFREGHEMANHGVQDKAMSNTKDYPTADTFADAVKGCNTRIEELQEKARQGQKDGDSLSISRGYTTLMERGLEKLDMYNVMCDAYAVDPIVENGAWIARSLERQAKDGSIILIHMPERGFREYCLTALKLLLEKLCVEKGYKIVTVSELQRISREQAEAEP